MDPEIIRLAEELVEGIKEDRERSRHPDFWSVYRYEPPDHHDSYERSCFISLALKSFLGSNTFTKEGHREAAQHLHRFFQQYDFKDLPEALRIEWDRLVFDLFSDYVYDDSWKYLPVLLELYEKAFQEVSASISATEVDHLKSSIDSLRVENQERELGFRNELIKAIQESKRRSDVCVFEEWDESIPVDKKSIERCRSYALVLQSMLNSNSFASEDHSKAARVILLFLNTFTLESPSADMRLEWCIMSTELFCDHIEGNSVDCQCDLLPVCEQTFQEVSASISAEEVDHLKISIDSLKMDLQSLERRVYNELFEEIQKLQQSSDSDSFLQAIDSIPFPFDSQQCYRLLGFALESSRDLNVFNSEHRKETAAQFLDFFREFTFESLSLDLWADWCKSVTNLFYCPIADDQRDYQRDLVQLWSSAR